MSAGEYTFLPWVRHGLANQIVASGPLRASVAVQLRLGVHQVDGADVALDFPPRDVQLYGPGDVTGLDQRAVIRTEPREWIANFEPNYLAAIEFYDEDMPWRYTPQAPDAAGVRLLPWIVLVVLKEDEFVDGGIAGIRPLPFVTLAKDVRQTAFPDPAHLWAWAHVHVNRGLTAGAASIVDADRVAVVARLDTALRENADLAYSRIICPRRLEANTSYHAFVLPAFESGRLAGLGLDPTLTPDALASAWTSNGPEPDNMPVYYRWRFRTGTVGDFEYLVRLLRHRPVDRRVGVRDLDVQRPGANLPSISDPAFHGVLQLGGALRVPRISLSPEERLAAERQERWADPTPHPFQSALASLVNLADSYTEVPAATANASTGLPGVAGDPDPIVAPPLYGRWHASTMRLLRERDGRPVSNRGNWVHELNLDPRFRVPAGFGTRVIQSKQEELMASAWAQLGDVLEANRRIRRLKVAQQAAFVWHQSHLQPLAATNPGRSVALTAPVHARVMARTGPEPLTMKGRVAGSTVPPALLAPTLRRLTRPRGRLMRALPFTASVRPDDLLQRVNREEIQPAPPKMTPPGVVTVADVAAGALPRGVPRWLVALLRRAPWIAFIPLLLVALALLLWMLGVGAAPAIALSVVGVALTISLRLILHRIRRADALLENNQTPEAVDDLARSPDFRLADPGAAFTPVTLTRSGSDSAEAGRFKAALKDVYALIRANGTADTIGENPSGLAPLDLDRDLRITVDALDPALTIPRRATSLISVPPRVQVEMPERFVEVMAYPVFDLPMYRPLAELSAELLVPNLNFIENNSVTLLETNQQFVEAYMVGLNHEFGRELLWREYPTDQRGSPFRQFWDVSSFLPGAGVDSESLRESLRDIPPLHRWSRGSALGDHDARERPGDNEEEVVLVIRGELLKRYPNAVIYAQAAEWTRSNGAIDRTKERSLVAISPAEEANPPREKLRTPLFTAKVEPDIYFLGFDLTAPAVRGGAGTDPADRAGWFFVIKERPGEPRFGFDEQSQAPIVVWNDLGWDRVPMSGAFVQPTPGPAPAIVIPSQVPPGQEEKDEQRTDDAHVRWNSDVSAAEMAYILYQAPVMVAIHGAELLPPA
jgi:hypothetical protein